MRGKPGRPWIKIHTTLLDSSINYELEADEIGVFVKLIVLAAKCSNNGNIADNDGNPYPRNFIARRLFVDEDLLGRTLTKCDKTNRIKENSKGIEIVNWGYYQDEYQRQKKYRQRAAINDPEKYENQGKFDNLVVRTPGDLKRIKKQRVVGK